MVKNLPLNAVNTNTGVKAYTAQDIGDMCSRVTYLMLVVICTAELYTGNTYYSGQGVVVPDWLTLMAIDYDAGLFEDDDTIIFVALTSIHNILVDKVSIIVLVRKMALIMFMMVWQASNFMRLTDQYHVYDVGYGPNPNRSDDVDMYVYISCVRYDLTCHAVNNSGDSSGPTGFSGIALDYSNGITTSQ